MCFVSVVYTTNDPWTKPALSQVDFIEGSFPHNGGACGEKGVYSKEHFETERSCDMW